MACVSTLLLLLLDDGVKGQQQDDAILDNRDTCSNRVVNCDPSVDHFETKIEMKHSSSVTKLEYHNTHVLLEQSWPTRGPWMKNTTQKVVLIRCGCPIPSDLSSDWIHNDDVNIIHVPVSSVVVQMPNSLSKVYMLGQRSKVAAIESSRWISATATPEVATDIRDGTVRLLDRSFNGKPSTRIRLSFTNGVFTDPTHGFRLQLVEEDASSMIVLGQTDCIYPSASVNDDQTETLETMLDRAFNSIPGWVDAGTVWVLTSGDAMAVPSTSLSYTLFFDHQLPMGLSLQGEAGTCGSSDVEFKIDRDVAPSNRPIYHRLHDLANGFPDVVITEPRSLGPLADDPKVRARQFLDADPGEATPLGRAELMKLIAVLVGSVNTGNTLFDLIELRYNNAKALAKTARTRPTVMVGKPGTWNEAARNSWMIMVGTTYVGQFLRDANVEYRNSDDSINDAVCGPNGCGVCPSGTSDTRCSVPLSDYLDLFRDADYWIVAGIGANCWSGSCNFQITSDDLLDQNRDIYSQFLPMQCGTLIGLDKAHSSSSGGNPYWELGRIRPDLILLDLVALMHPDVKVPQDDTTFFRMLPAPTNKTGLPACPRTLLPVKVPSGTVYVTANYVVKITNPPSATSSESMIIGAPRFAILDRFSPTLNVDLASKLGVNKNDLEIVLTNGMEHDDDDDDDDSSFTIAVTVRVSKNNCQDHSCGVSVGEKLSDLGPDIERSLGLSWITVDRDDTVTSVRILDHKGDIIPLTDLLFRDEGPTTPDNNNDGNAGESRGSSSSDMVDGEPIMMATTGTDDDDDKLSSGALAGIVVGVLAAFVVSIFATYKSAYARGVNDTRSLLDKGNDGIATSGGEALGVA